MTSSQERRAEWRRLIDDQLASGMSVAEWCRVQGISLNSFYYRRKHVISENTDPSVLESSPQRIIRGIDWVSVSEPKEQVLTVRVGRVAIDVPYGFDQRLLRDVLSVLEARC
jgi:hypothetical protein